MISMNLLFSKRNGILLLFCLILQIIVGINLTNIYLLSHNTIENSLDWISTKMTLVKGVSGAEHFLTELQALAKGRMNLSAWNGYQELIFKKALELQEVEFRVWLETNSYIIFIFNKSDEEYKGIRLSVAPYFKSIYFRASDEGEFKEKKELKKFRLSEKTWHSFKMRFHEKGFSVFLDNRNIGEFKTPLNDKQIVGFRGGQNPSFIDDVSFTQKNYGIHYISFNRPKKFFPTFLFSLFFVILGNIVFLSIYIMVTKSRRKAGHLQYSMIALNFVLIICSTLVLWYRYYRAQYYPTLTDKMLKKEEYWKNANTEYTLKQIHTSYSEEIDNTTYRILFIGSSQTWGAGASKEDDTFVTRIEKMLNANTNQDMKFECINGGLSAVVSSDLVKYYRERWLKLYPRMVVINLSNNDQEPEGFESSIKDMIEIGYSAKIKTLLVLEPNSIEYHNESLLRNHEIMRKLGRLYNIPVIDMHNDLLKNYDKGFLWWDFVHLTSFGQKLFAQRLYKKIEQHI